MGKIVAMWLPIMTFFAQGFEHSIVNMFVVPAGMMFGAPVSTASWLFWNQLPVTLGNIISGAIFTGLALYATYCERRPAAFEGTPVEAHSQPDGGVGFAPATGVTQ
jgi:formate transporter